ncbi:ACDE family multidrug resistance protein [Bacillus pakistanensis]|uniref:ACDE family multidrug resistance protein n=2 Tax=Rossellomorea pakistanensis TaxID=992288 RepID=A0ABS2NCS9_9BACI|nr:MFS transporter [Bacillus pakistanensis]MBM7585559.1 ACDE family multidrug resistance protein [Bacillus pakistanensis]
MKSKKIDLLAVSSVPLVMTLGNSMLIPVLPLIEQKLNITSFQVSLIITVYSIVAIILIPIAGYLSDRFGRKCVMVPCLIIAGIGGAISGWASWKMQDPFTMILVGRVLQGIGSAGAAPVVIPLIGDMFNNDDEITSGLGLIETSNTAGKVLSPIIGAFLASFIWFLPFWFIPFFSFISVLLVSFLVKKPEQDQKKQSISEFVKSVKGTFKENGTWLYTVFFAGCIIMFVLFGVLFYLSDMLEKKYHIDGVYKGFLLAVPLIFLSISSFIAGKKIGESKKLMKLVIAGGMALLAFSFAALRLQHSFIFLLTFLVFSGIGIGAALPCLDALITEGIEKAERGTITSFYSAMRFIGVAAGPPAYAYLMSVSDHLIFYVSGGISLIALIIVFLFIKPDREKKNTIKYA